MRPGKPFASAQSVGALDAKAAARIIAAAADIALVVGPDGLVRDFACRSADLEDDLKSTGAWRGRPFAETVTADSRVKLNALVENAQGEGELRLRHVNHPGDSGTDIAMQYSAVRARQDGTVVAFGRDLRPLSALQQRLIDAQQTLERDYASLRQAQTRYRLLFETSPEPLMVLDAASLRITEVNAAGRLLLPEARGRSPAARSVEAQKRSRFGQTAFAELFEPRSRPAVQRFLAGVQIAGASAAPNGQAAPGQAAAAHGYAAGAAASAQAAAAPGAAQAGASTASATQAGAGPQSGRADTLRCRLLDGSREVSVSASLLREDEASLLLVRLSFAAPGTEASALNEQVLAALKQSPDGLVFTDAAGEVLSANAAFLDLAQLGSLDQAVGRPLDDWMGRPGVDVDVLLANLRQRGSVRLFASRLRGEHGAETEVEVSAVAIAGEGRTACCLSVRDVGRRLPAAEPKPTGGLDLPRSPEQLTELIGRVSLKELVRDATDVIEKLCIEAALELTDDNRASAAEMLGLSRQSLYVKLRRYGLGDLADNEE